MRSPQPRPSASCGALCLLCVAVAQMLWLVAAAPVAAAVRLPAVIDDQMVLQQQSRAPIWGWATPGEVVSVKPSWMKRPIEVAADEAGRWRVALPTPAAGGPHQLVIRGENEITLQGILIGEVWVCSGQSNMEWPVSRADDAEAEIAAADHPRLRLFKVQRAFAASPQEDCTGAWVECSPESVASFSAVGYYFGRRVHEELDVPVGLIQAAWGGTVCESWTSEEGLADMPEFEAPLAALQRLRDDPDALKESDRGFHQNWPTALHNGMIAPVVPFGIRGAIWYQGESNRTRAEQYRTLFPTMIRDWRSKWSRGEFPFYFVQIAPFAYENDAGQAAELREAQRLALRTPNTGMAVTMDIGNPRDIHPTNKQEVGRRLALWALAKTYGHDDLVYAGPLYRDMQREDGGIRLSFDHVGSGLLSKGGELTHFEIAGEDGEFVEAKAKIEGDTVFVSSDSVEKPVAVRYGWGAADEPNLFNKEGLPASSFLAERQ